MISSPSRPHAAPVRAVLVSALLCLPFTVAAQSSCASDGQPQPVALLERFINADCESCWRDPKAPAAGRSALALDWVVPGSRGEDAPLSAVARRDGLTRLQSLGRAVPRQADSARTPRRQGAQPLRVAHGLPLGGYIGASIELESAGPGPWKAWLVLVETLPPGTEDSPVERNLVRNVLQPAWNNKAPLSKEEQKHLFESRPMNIPEGARGDRLRVVGWVEDARGHIRGIAQSRCVPEGSKG